MSTLQRFALGGLGGLLTVLVSIYSLDVVSVINNWELLSTANCIGYSIKVIILIVLGGTIAALNSDILKPWALVQLGIAAPALITSYINGTGVSGPTEKTNHAASTVTLVSPAHAAEGSDNPLIPAGFLSDVLQGATVPLPKIQRDNQQQLQEKQQQQKQPQQQPQSSQQDGR